MFIAHLEDKIFCLEKVVIFMVLISVIQNIKQYCYGTMECSQTLSFSVQNNVQIILSVLPWCSSDGQEIPCLL